MVGCYIWCNACDKQHESREKCPKGWVRSLWELKFISPEEGQKEIENLVNVMEEK